MLKCNCPLENELVTVPYDQYCEVFGKDARWFFQRLDDANNEFADISLESNWTALPDATDDTKIAVTPLLEDVEFPEPDLLEAAENYDGAAIVVSTGPSKCMGMVRNPSPAQVTALRSMACNQNITFYRIDSAGNFGARVTSGGHAGIKISPNTMGIKGPFRGPGRVDMFLLKIEFSLAFDWYDTFAQVAPEAGFDPLTEVVPS